MARVPLEVEGESAPRRIEYKVFQCRMKMVGSILTYLRHLQFGPRATFFSPVAAAAAIGINPSFDTGVPAGVGAAAIDTRAPFNRTSLPTRAFHLLVL
jgi:hypothetical protein